jgi:hypothetical protein
VLYGCATPTQAGDIGINAIGNVAAGTRKSPQPGGV